MQHLLHNLLCSRLNLCHSLLEPFLADFLVQAIHLPLCRLTFGTLHFCKNIYSQQETGKGNIILLPLSIKLANIVQRWAFTDAITHLPVNLQRLHIILQRSPLLPQFSIELTQVIQRLGLAALVTYFSTYAQRLLKVILRPFLLSQVGIHPAQAIEGFPFTPAIQFPAYTQGLLEICEGPFPLSQVGVHLAEILERPALSQPIPYLPANAQRLRAVLLSLASLHLRSVDTIQVVQVPDLHSTIPYLPAYA